MSEPDLYARLAASMARFADKVAIETADRDWTYRDLESAAARLAAVLRNRGVTPGERVLAQTDKSVEAVVLYLATLRLGAIYLPLNIDYTESELAYFVADATPVLAVCRNASRDLFRRIGGNALAIATLDDLFADLTDADASVFARQPGDVAAILYTSGTTGKPKGAMLTHRNLVSNGETLIDFWRFTPDDRLIHALPIFHVHGLFVALHCAFFSGAAVIFQPRFDPQAVIAAMPRAKVLMGVPTFYIRLLNDPAFTREAASAMRLFVSGSAPLSADIHRAFEARTGHRVLERYGMTETGMITSNPYEGARKAGFVGPPLPGVSVRIAGEDGAPLPDGEVGIVEVNGPNVFAGYWQMPEKTASEFRPGGWFITGDMGLIDADGYVQLVGREKDLIISGGLNVYPAEVEALLDDRDDVAEAAVIGVPHPDFGEAVVAVVRPSGRLDEDAVRADLRRDLAGFKVPRRIIAVDELPRNTMGKIQKKVLRERYADLFAQD
ncbi:AMP-binding protein [Croceicoccus sp. BE223]|uniref:AMP-binding protein n=1 Tax=Croceicoccus sp. BE223 TaxID=2817716 RepID=UPI00285F0240|nr:AMP-binding protein [Croceicoccus sp. BE223]MDR7102312.1 malonyl-CoA/methylmalonyl-CoA synthetase [Croceicoccus sp. BE223]